MPYGKGKSLSVKFMIDEDFRDSSSFMKWVQRNIILLIWNIKGLIRVKFFLKCDPRRFLIISRFFDMENTMQLLKNSGRSIFFDVNPICQPVTGCARNRKIFFWISWLQIDITRLVSTTLTLYPTLKRYMKLDYGWIRFFALTRWNKRRPIARLKSYFLRNISSLLTMQCSRQGREDSIDVYMTTCFNWKVRRTMLKNSKKTCSYDSPYVTMMIWFF